MPGAIWLWTLSLLTVLATVLVLAGVDSPVRVVAVLSFMLAVPGIALARAIGIDDLAATLTIGIATSIAVNILIAGGLLYADLWEPNVVLLAQAAITASLIFLAAINPPTTAETAES